MQLVNLMQARGDELEWTRSIPEQRFGSPFIRKVKMCIVQREETLELIATRYQVQPESFNCINRLNMNPYLSEGQVIYIPNNHLGSCS